MNIMAYANSREMLDEEAANDVVKNESGKIGEAQVLSWIRQFGNKDWQIWTNIWVMSPGGGFAEADIVIMTPGQLLILEVKNYVGRVEIEPHEARLRGKVMDRSPLEQTRRTLQIFSGLAADFPFPVTVRAALIFPHEFCQLRVSEGVGGDIPILTRSQIRDFLWQQSRGMSGSYHNHQLQDIQSWINRHSCENPYLDQDYGKINYDRHKPGIVCDKCWKMNFRRTHKLCICNHCGHRETRVYSFIRTVYEYCALYRVQEFSVQDIVDHCGDFYSRDYILRRLNKYMKRSAHCKRGKYELPYKTLDIFTSNHKI